MSHLSNNISNNEILIIRSTIHLCAYLHVLTLHIVLQHVQFVTPGHRILPALFLVEVALKPELALTARMLDHSREIATSNLVVRCC